MTPNPEQRHAMMTACGTVAALSLLELSRRGTRKTLPALLLAGSVGAAWFLSRGPRRVEGATPAAQLARRRAAALAADQRAPVTIDAETGAAVYDSSAGA